MSKLLHQPIDVLYIGGYGRSGSTLFGAMIGHIPGFCFVGEMTQIFGKGLQRNHLCSCGTPFLSCPFWSAVCEEAYGHNPIKHLTEIKALKREVERTRRIPQLTFCSLRSKHFQTHLIEYTAYLTKLYQAIQKVSGGDVIVDSSKLPTYGHVLASIHNLKLHIVHVTRDSRAVAYSWQRKKAKSDIQSGQGYMSIRNDLHSAFEYNVKNGFIQTLGWRAASYQQCRYEDFIVNPTLIKNLLAKIGVDSTKITVPTELHGNQVHAVSVNPMLFQQGKIVLKPDYEWQSKMSQLRKLKVGILTMPLLLQFGYNPIA